MELDKNGMLPPLSFSDAVMPIGSAATRTLVISNKSSEPIQPSRSSASRGATLAVDGPPLGRIPPGSAPRGAVPATFCGQFARCWTSNLTAASISSALSACW